MSADVLLFGADGQLGTELRRALARRNRAVVSSALGGALPEGGEALACDLSTPGAAAALIDAQRPRLVLNAAAYTAVDRAETDAALAQRLNADVVDEIGEAAKRVGATVVHYSTDYVFAGDATQPYRETDATGPRSVYGRSKRDGELALKASGADALTFRLAWVYAAHSQNFLRTMLRVGAERDALRVVADQIGAPTPAHWIAEATLDALDADARGLFHLAPDGHTSWHAYAEAIFAGAVARGLLAKAPTVEAIPSSAYPTPAQRPAWSVLDSSALASATGLRLPHWQQGLDEVLDALAAQR